MRTDPDGRTILAEKSWDWMLLRDSEGRLIVSVVCGSVGLYEVEVILDDETIAAYEADGIAVIERLAADIAEHPSRYRRASQG